MSELPADREAVLRGDQLLPGEAAYFEAVTDTVYDEEDFGNAFQFVDCRRNS